MKADQPSPDDALQIRCSKLGHQINFSYCRTENFGLPCPRALACWHPYFDIAGYLRHELTPEQWQDAFEKPVQQKILSLAELIEKVQRQKKSDP